jgi:hypothetical protein
MTDLATVKEAAARRAVFDYASTKAEAWETELAQFGALWRAFNASLFGGALDEPHAAIGSSDLVSIAIHTCVCDLSVSAWARLNGHPIRRGVEQLREALSILADHYVAAAVGAAAP